MMWKYKIIIALSFIPVSFMNAQDTASPAVHKFSAQQCVDFAFTNNVQVKNALLNIKIQEQTNRSITAAAYPQINGNINASHYPNITVQSFPNFIAAATYGVLVDEGVLNGSGQPIKSPEDFGFIEAAFGTKWNASAGVSLSQILFDGQVFVGLQARQTSIDFQQKNVEVTETLIKANIYKVYYQLAASKTQIEQLNANIARLEKLQHDAGELFKNGFVEKLDVDRASVQLTNLKTEKLSVQNTINNGYLGLKLLLGMPAKDSLLLTDSVNEEKVKEGLLNEGNYQYADRKDYNYLKLGEKLNEYNVRRYKLSKIPTANLTAGYSKLAYRNQFDFFGSGSWFPSSYIALNINIPIFQGFAADANIKKAELEFQQAQNQITDLELSIDNQVAQAINNFRTAVNTLDAQKQNMQLAEEIYNQTKKKYETGIGSTLDITNAQSDLLVAQSNYINALYNAIIAKIDYLNATGKL
ncbi:MAG: TolC family protein [Parafilimonas sp.]